MLPCLMLYYMISYVPNKLSPYLLLLVVVISRLNILYIVIIILILIVVSDTYTIMREGDRDAILKASCGRVKSQIFGVFVRMCQRSTYCTIQ